MFAPFTSLPKSIQFLLTNTKDECKIKDYKHLISSLPVYCISSMQISKPTEELPSVILNYWLPERAIFLK